MDNSGFEGRSEGARRAGEKLLSEVQTEGLGSLLSSLRELMSTGAETKYFGIPELDALLQQPAALPSAPIQQPDHQRQNDGLWNPDQAVHSAPPLAQNTSLAKKKTSNQGGPILELVSPPSTHHLSSSGKTSLVYMIAALAVLPSTISSIPISGQNAAIIVFDPLSHFSVARLTETIIHYIKQRLRCAERELKDDEALQQELKSVIERSLMHVHIFRPQGWDNLLATLKELPEYLFDANRHKSMSRRIHSVVIEDVDAFYWNIRSSTATSGSANTNPLTTASARLTRHLLSLSKLLSCITILSSHSNTPNSFRPAIPLSWPSDTQVTRLALRKVEVLPFAPGISVEDAESERSQRWEVVQRGRFECWKVGAGVKDGEGFAFRVTPHGVEIEKDER